jgi:Cof subfamily protein (haloacid dehalogenase superfamily)
LAKKLLVCDLDGTLLDSIKGLSQKFTDKLNFFLDEGIDLSIATGRDFENTHLVIQNTHIRNPIILTNGAILAEYPSGSILDYLTIPPKTVERIYEFAEEFCLETLVFATYDKTNNLPRFIKGTWWDIENIRRLHLEEYQSYLDDPVISIQFMNPKSHLDEMFSQTSIDSNISMNSHILYFEDSFLPGMYWLEYNAANARKEVMLAELIQKKGYSLEDTIVFGDNFNDVGMLELAGTAVVVENAPNEIKKIADHIIPSNLDGGVLQYIQENLEDLI